MGYRILILVDHAKHNITNSSYDLAKSFRKHQKVGEVIVASRSTPRNQDFFYGLCDLSFSGIPVDADFSFDPSGNLFLQTGPMYALIDFDLVILRIAHPINSLFFDYLSANLPQERFINQPNGIMRTGGKDFLLQFPQWCPPMQWCHTIDDIKNFHRNFDLVLKPLRNYGGKGIFKVEKGKIIAQNGDQWDLASDGHVLEQLEADGYLAMQYLQNVRLGDKRIVVVNGKIVGASLRKPAEGSWLCNVSQGGSSEASMADEREVEMAICIHETVAQMGVGIFGMDTLVNDEGQRVLSEINTLSVGGIGPMELQHQKPVLDHTVDLLLVYFENYKM
ncbi:MAG: glutathione synthetase [Saprospiraceae bacterium]|nr:glutathione synthetase [Saprospiraceae bacterium]